jgi:hypothetical protein
MKTLTSHICLRFIRPLLLAAPLLILFSFSNDPSVLQEILQKMKLYHEQNLQEKLYVHLDKPFYAAGEDIWFKAYLMEASLHSLDSQSRVIYVELIDKEKTILHRKVLYVTNGVVFGDIHLEDSLTQGKYLLRGYSNYMKNAGDDFFFQREISILNAKTAAADTVEYFHKDSIDVIFFPEGGDLVACGSENQIAFKALSPDGKGFQVEGEIVDEAKNVITTFQVRHDGMGSFRFKPVAGKKYSARITKPYPVKQEFALPAVKEKGYCLQVTENAKSIKAVIVSNIDKPASGKLTLGLVVQSRGNVYFAQQPVLATNATFTYIPRTIFPDGISQITLFDPEGRPVAERLVYQNQNETISLNVTPDQASYGKRSLVTVDAKAMFRNGAAAEGNFSMSVYDDRLITSPEKYPLTITNYLSLTSDLKGLIENPGYYFKDSLPETKKDLDLLMMVHGWRRFTWAEVLAENPAAPKYNREQGLPISGRILKPASKNAPEDSNIKILAMATGDVVIVKGDSLGRFYTDHFLFYDSMDLVIQTENAKGKKKPYKFVLDPFNPTPAPDYSLTAFTPFDASAYLEQQYEQNVVENAKLTSETKQLKEVEITATKIEKEDPFKRRIGSKQDEINVKAIGGENYQSIFQLLQARAPGVVVSGNPPNMSVKVRGQDPVFLLDGSVSSAEMVSMMSPSMVEAIEVIKGPAASVYGGTAVIHIMLKAGAWDTQPVGVNQVKYRGFNAAREFYSPRYDVADDRHNLTDKRTTLFWHPMVSTNTNGEARLTFYTADVSSRYRIVIEGITPNGYPGTATVTFEVK